jgi:hypothetical protein
MATISIELEVPDAVIAMGGVTLYAQSKGWKDTITTGAEVTRDDGFTFTEYTTVTNPISALEFAKLYFKEMVKKDFRELYLNLKSAEDMETRSSEFNSLFQ